MATDINRLVSAYTNLRRAREQLAREFKKKDSELKEKMALLDVYLLKTLQDTKQKSARTESGTAYIFPDTNFACADWNKAFRFMVQHDAFEMVQKRLNKKYLTDYMEEHKGKLPPAIKAHTELSVRVRTANEKD
jgi:hypothetical protein